MSTIKLPFTIKMDAAELQTQHSPVEVRNPFSGESCTLPRYASKVYYKIKIAELDEDYATMRKGLDWFQKHFTDQYYVLLD
jgi:hypothetical protein